MISQSYIFGMRKTVRFNEVFYLSCSNCLLFTVYLHGLYKENIIFKFVQHKRFEFGDA